MMPPQKTVRDIRATAGKRKKKEKRKKEK